MPTGLESIELDELISLSLDDRQIDLHVALPARVTAYHSSSQTVDVVPQLNRWLPDGQGGHVYEPLPALSDVPVLFPRCTQFAITFPVAAGDFVMLLFSERSLAAWRTSGQQVNPGDLRMHGLDGAVAIPGVFPDAKPVQNANGSNMVVGSDTDGNSRIEIKPTGGINIGSGATKGAARNGDSVDNGTLVFFPGTGAASLAFIPPGGTVLPATPPTINIPLSGQINSGSTKIKIID